jgi:predicted 2-oxoglutarate/Fe(II)-dependent dioxygenase YbiX/peroxiredoxin
MSYTAEAPPPEGNGYRRLAVGDPAPWFAQATSSSPRVALDLLAGRYLVLCFLMDTSDPAGQRALDLVAQNRELFDDEKISFHGVTVNWRDQHDGRTEESLPGVRFFWDFDLTVSRLYGVAPANAGSGVISVRRKWVILDPTLRIVASVRFEKDGAERPAVLEILRNLPPARAFAGVDASPPILYLPNVFEPDLCARLVAAFDQHGGQESGSLVQVGDETVPVHDHGHKWRLDHLLEDWDLMVRVKARIQRRVVPEMAKAFAFQATKMERYLVGCYGEGGHFALHRDNTTTATEHRRFAVSVNLNDGYDGGELRFPEYGPRRFKPAVGTAVVFSCSLLHGVSPVTRGKRYAFLPFLHDDAADAILERNHGPRATDDQATPPPMAEARLPSPAAEAAR